VTQRVEASDSDALQIDPLTKEETFEEASEKPACEEITPKEVVSPSTMHLLGHLALMEYGGLVDLL
jgi:hypothetical protein